MSPRLAIARRSAFLPAVVLIPVCAALIAAFAHGAKAQSAGGPFAGIGHDRGSAATRVTIVEFGDFGCGYCAKFAAETYPQIDSAFIRTGRVFWKFVPFVTGNFHNSREAAETAECVADQDGFWKMHDLLYARRKEWMASDQPRTLMLRYVKELKLDVARFTQCSNTTTARLRIMHNDMLATTMNLRGTPTFYVNGRVVAGAIPFDLFRQLIDAASR